MRRVTVIVQEILLGLVYISIFLSYAVRAATPNISWLYPNWSPASPTLNYVDTLNASWESNYPRPYLVRWCSGDSFQTFGPCSNNSVPSNGHLAVNMSSSSTDPNCRPNALGCHFELYSPSDSNYASNSDRWFVTTNAAAQPLTWNATNATTPGGTTSVSPGTPVTTTVSGAPVTITGTATGQPSSPSPSPVPPPTGLSTGAKAGIGVGVVAGVIALAAIAFAAYRFHRRKLARNEGVPTSPAMEKVSPNALGLHELQQATKPQELQATKSLRYHELQNTPRPQELEGSAMGEQGAVAPTHELDQKERRDEE